MSVTEQVMDADEFLAHYGVKGMKWGVHTSKRKIARLGDGNRSDITKTDQRNFRRDARAVKKKKLILLPDDKDWNIEKDNGGKHRRIVSDFEDNNGRKLSTTYANALANKEAKRRTRNGNIAAVAIVATPYALYTAAKYL